MSRPAAGDSLIRTFVIGISQHGMISASGPAGPMGFQMDIRILSPILLVVFTCILGAAVILAILPLHAEGEFHGTVFQITLLATAFFGAQFLAAPWLGRLSDRLGRRPVLLLSRLGMILAFILFIFAGPLGRWVGTRTTVLRVSGGMAVLHIARLLDGITGGNITTARAYVSDMTDQFERAHGLGLLQGRSVWDSCLGRPSAGSYPATDRPSHSSARR
jgi:MFS family permease